MGADYIPEDFDINKWRLFRKFNNREERNARHIDAWFFDQSNMPKEEWERRLQYNKEHLIKDTLEQIANSGLFEDEE